jgi:hypothetical protein
MANPNKHTKQKNKKTPIETKGLFLNTSFAFSAPPAKHTNNCQAIEVQKSVKIMKDIILIF